MSWHRRVHRSPLRTAGFTLIELMVAVSLSLVLIYGLYTLFNQATAITTRADTLIQITQNARHILDFMHQQIVGAYVDETYRSSGGSVSVRSQQYMWAQNVIMPRYIPRTATVDPHFTGSGASLSNSDDETYGRLAVPNREPAHCWRPDELLGLFVRTSAGEVRLIRGNGENSMTVDPIWTAGSTGSQFTIPRNADRLLFFTNNAQAWGRAADQGVMAQTLVMFAIDDATLEEPAARPRRPPTLKAVVATRRSQSGKFEPDRTLPAEVGRYVTDLNIEYGENVWDNNSTEPRLVYRQCDERSVGTMPDPHGKWRDDHWAAYAESFQSTSSTSENYPRDPSTGDDMISSELRDLLFNYFPGDAVANSFEEAVRFRRLPAALRVTIRITDRSGRESSSFSQVMHIPQAIVGQSEGD